MVWKHLGNGRMSGLPDFKSKEDVIKFAQAMSNGSRRSFVVNQYGNSYNIGFTESTNTIERIYPQ